MLLFLQIFHNFSYFSAFFWSNILSQTFSILSYFFYRFFSILKKSLTLLLQHLSADLSKHLVLYLLFHCFHFLVSAVEIPSENFLLEKLFHVRINLLGLGAVKVLPVLPVLKNFNWQLSLLPHAKNSFFIQKSVPMKTRT